MFILHPGLQFLYSSTAAGVPFVKVLNDAGIVCGIKADTGMQNLPSGETATQGLDGLADKCKA